MLCGLVHVSIGQREWEIQAHNEQGYLANYSGPPYLTKREAQQGRQLLRGMNIYDQIVVRNVRTGEASPESDSIYP